MAPGALVAGPRMGRFGPDGKPRHMPGHNCVFYLTGALLLWYGFYGFNPGTMGQLIAADGSSFAMVSQPGASHISCVLTCQSSSFSTVIIT